MNDMHIADLADVRAFAATLPTKYVVCRDGGHNFAPHDAYELEGGGYERVRKCRSCGTLKTQELTNDFVILRTSYAYPPGYTAEAGTGRIDGEGRCVFRGAALMAEMKMLHNKQRTH
ncbi:hypothetical protein [Streptomyces sp. NPDC017448]|uniref:hypothetical protein n=1 Tax=Streptomyces sp. NPDC017448 TaxID=3364996 RepID=UPI00379A34B0